MIILIPLFGLILFLAAARLERKRRKALEFGHYVWDGRWVVDAILEPGADAVPSAKAVKHPLQRLEEVGEGSKIRTWDEIPDEIFEFVEKYHSPWA